MEDKKKEVKEDIKKEETKKAEIKKATPKKNNAKKEVKSETPKKETVKADKKEVEKTESKKTDKVEIKEIPEANAILRHERISPSKLNQIAKLVRGKDVEEAAAILRFSGKKAGYILGKVLNSAIANAKNNHFMDENKLYISEINVMQGPTLKRLRPRAKGAANRIRKRTSHVEIVLQEKQEK